MPGAPRSAGPGSREPSRNRLGPLGFDPTDKSPGAQFEITIDSVSRTWRDPKGSALDAARNLKGRNLGSDVKVIERTAQPVRPLR